jgi:hypothetical protein
VGIVVDKSLKPGATVVASLSIYHFIDIRKLLESMNKDIKDYPLPEEARC